MRVNELDHGRARMHNLHTPETVGPGRFHGEAVPGQTICIYANGA